VPPTRTQTDAQCQDASADCYELRVLAAQASIPPLTLLIALPEDRTLQGVQLAVGPGVQLPWTGTIQDATMRGLPGLSVRLMDAAGRVVSNTTTTSDATEENPGGFGLTIPLFCAAGEAPSLTDACLEQGDHFWLDIRESSDAPHAAHFVVRLAMVDGVLASPTVALPPLLDKDLVQMTYLVTAPGQNGENVRVPGATVTAATVIDGVEPLQSAATCTADICGNFVRQATTDENGSVTLTLLGPAAEGTRSYSFQVTPGANSLYASLTATVEVDQGPHGPDIVLQPKLQVSGTLTDAAGTPIPGATVSAVARETAVVPPDNKSVVTYGLDQPPATIETDARGSFLLLAEDGVTYDLTIVPPTGSPYPVWVLSSQAFSGTPGPLAVQLPPAALVRGGVADWTGTAVSGVLVRFYQTLSDPDSGATSVILRGEAVSADDGSLRLLLPVP
jgi:hypothetical protein